MTRDKNSTARAVIDAARALERASQYGINTVPATRDYERARREQKAVIGR